jgi:hypothetical protein
MQGLHRLILCSPYRAGIYFAMSSVGFILIIDMDQIINGIIDGFFHVSLHD